MTVGQRIKNRRKELDMTQEELAARLGYSHKSSIAKIETGRNDLTQKRIVEFAHALNTTVAYILGWDEEEEQQQRMKAFAEDTVLFKELSDVWSKMDDSQKRTFLSLGHALLNTSNQRTD